MDTIPVYRCQLIRDSGVTIERARISQPVDAVAVARTLIGDYDREALLAIFVSVRNEVVGAQVVSIGTLDSALAEPREVFKAAILAGAAGVILAHNHPSGHPDPSANDRSMTSRMIACGLLVGIDVLDHLILGEGDRYTSLRAEGKVNWDEPRQWLDNLRSR